MAGEIASTSEDRAIDALTKILESAISPDMLEAQKIILRRLALSGDLFPSRVPAPRNITEVGGYFNLLADDPILLSQTLAAAVGVAGPNPPLGWEPTLPPLYLAARPNDRPAPVAAAVPVTFMIRNDFMAPLDAALAWVHERGAVLPILSTSAPLPPASVAPATPDDLLPYLGRVLQIVPSAALANPATDPIAVGSQAAGPVSVVARQLDAAAPSAGSVPSAAWDLFTCTTTACTQGSVTDRYLPLTQPLNDAGWYQAVLTAPTALGDHAWSRWTNTTGLVPGTTRFGDELGLIYSAGGISQSSLRDRLDWTWDGTGFIAPA